MATIEPRTKFYLLTYCFFLCLFVLPAKSTSCDHQGTFDLVILLDSSGSVGSTDFHKQTSFLADLVSQFEVGPNRVQVAAATFSSTVYSEFNLTTYQDTSFVVGAIRNITFKSGGTATDLALEYAREVMFTDGNGHRSGALKVILLSTDGVSNNRTSTLMEASLLKQDGVKIFPIAVGSGVDISELQAVATNSSDVFKIDSFDTIQDFLPSLQKSLCLELQETSSNESTSAPTTWITGRPFSAVLTSTLANDSVFKPYRTKDWAWSRTSLLVIVSLGFSNILLVVVTSILLCALLSSRHPCRKNKVNPVSKAPLDHTLSV